MSNLNRGEGVEQPNENFEILNGSTENIVIEHNVLETSNEIIEIALIQDSSELNCLTAVPLTSSQDHEGETLETVICLDCSQQKTESCALCSRQASILSNRDENHLGQKKAADKMLSSAAKKLPPLKIGDCVLLTVGKIDRGPSDMQNLICVIVDHRNGVFQRGSSAGKIKGWYNRVDIIAADNQFLNIESVPDKYISVREAESKVSLRDGQGYLKCSCRPSKTQCATNRCACFKKKVMCNSRCHNSDTCLNK